MHVSLHVSSLALASMSTPALAWVQLYEFADPYDISTGVRRNAIAVPIDMDLDGDLDVASCSRRDDLVVWFENEGRDTLARRHVVTRDVRSPLGVAGADFDADGDVDLLVTSQYQNQVWYLEGDGAGGYRDPVALGSSTFIGQRIEVADLDGDGDLDAIVSNRIGAPFGPGPRLIENLGSAMAPARSVDGLYEGRYHVLPRDLDGDGLPELISTTSGYVHWSANLGGLSFGSPVSISNTFTAPDEIALADFDGDGDDDIVVGMNVVAELRFFENLSTPGTIAFGPQLVVPTGSIGDNEVAVVDMDLDGDLDVAISRGGHAGLAWLENTGGLTFSLREGIANERPQERTSLTAVDLDGDAQLDLLTSSLDGEIDWIRGEASLATGLAFEAETRPIATRIKDAADVAFLDADSDGDVDVLTAARDFGLMVSFQRGAGRFDTPISIGVADEIAASVDAGDMDGDGDDDVLFSDEDGRIGWMEQSAAGFGAANVLAQFPPATLELAPRLADIDRDGDLDVVAAIGTSGHSEAVVFEQLVPGSFLPERRLATSSSPLGALTFGEINGDGLVDALVTSGSVLDQELRWLPGAGDGRFGASQPVVAPGMGSLYPALLDTDFDGRDEIYWLEHGSSSLRRVQWIVGLEFTTPILVRDIGGLGRALLVRDVDLDGRRDLVVAHVATVSQPDETYSWVQGTGPLFFGLTWIIATSDAPSSSITLGDFDQDGDFDLLTAVRTESRVNLHENLTRVPLGIRYCDPAALNSVGLSGQLSLLGSERTSINDLRLSATNLPPSTPTLFLTSQTGGVVTIPPGSAGSLCLGGAVGRFAGPGQIRMSNQDGASMLRIDLTALPQPNGSVAAMFGQLWSFQAWYRDPISTATTSNFTDAVAVVLR